MAMKYKGEGTVAALVCGVGLLICVVFPAILVIGIPAAIGGIVALVVKHKKEKEKEQLFYDTIKYTDNLDRKSEKDFELDVRALIRSALENGYKASGMVDSIDNADVRYYQSVDNIGIAVIRNDFGNKLVCNGVVVTNRYLTPKAKEFCRNGRISVIDRIVIEDMYRYLYKCANGNSHK